MAHLPYRILERKRAGMRLTEEEIRAVALGAADGSWSEGQLGAFLMAAAIRGLDGEETRSLTLAMLESGERWDLRRDVPNLCDKHSTGGVGDKVSLVLAPILAACDLPVAMLAGRGLGHTAGTMDKLECIPGLSLPGERAECVAAIRACGMSIGGASGSIAPADRRLYAIRDVTATVDSMPLIVGSILSKKLALGAAGVVFDVKVGSGAFLPELDQALELARALAATANALGTPTACVVTDMNQPLGRFSGHAAELWESFEALEGRGPADLMEVTYVLCEEVARLVGQPVTRQELEEAVSSGRARERFDQWAALQGGDPVWLKAPKLPLAPVVQTIRADRSGKLARIDVRQAGMLLGEAGAGRARPGDAIDFGVSLESITRLGEPVRAGDPLAKVYLRKDHPDLVRRLTACYEIGDTGAAPELIAARVG
jgi:pyrimidine-nucleoside phosphorylase